LTLKIDIFFSDSKLWQQVINVEPKLRAETTLGINVVIEPKK